MLGMTLSQPSALSATWETVMAGTAISAESVKDGLTRKKSQTRRKVKKPLRYLRLSGFNFLSLVFLLIKISLENGLALLGFADLDF